MKNLKRLQSMFAIAIFAFASIGTIHAQTNLGADCGCPPVASRTTVNMSTLADVNGNLTATNTILTCDKTYIIDKKISVQPGKIITINPGSLLKGKYAALPADASALIIERGGKIIAAGEETCPIVFTAEADPMDGTYGVENKGQWGGLVILGKATNNLTLAANGYANFSGKLAVADGLGLIEGFATDDPRYYFGADLNGTKNGGTPEAFDDNDNSGILKYVSVRFTGAVLTVGQEINGVTLGSVGRGTTIEHLEIISSGDDMIEFFGGTVNVKYVSVLFGNDDMFDYDDGYTGKMQFLFGLKTDNSASADNDNGFEADADDQKSNLLPRSHPVAYNCTFIGNGKTVKTSDNSALAAINAKELTEGEIYNSVFANWKFGLNLVKALGAGRVAPPTGAGEAYHNWADDANGNGSTSFKFKCNTFTQSVVGDLSVDQLSASHRDSVQFYTTDKNIHLSSVTGFDYALAMNNHTNVISHPVSVVPIPGLSTTGCPTAPVDGFFVPAPYRGAFDPNKKPWISQFAYEQILQATSGLQPCSTDINGDMKTDNGDFLLLLGKFNETCR